MSVARGVWMLSIMLPAAVAGADTAPAIVARAHAAAEQGNCARVVELGDFLRETDPEVYRTAFVTDHGIARCLATEAAAPRSEPLPLRPLSPGKLVGEVGVGAVLGAPCALLGAVVGFEIGGGGLLGAYGIGGGILAGWTIGVPLGVYAVGSTGGETGSLATTEVGGLLGGAAGIGVLYAAHGEGPAIAAAIVAPIAGAIIGFNLTREPKPPETIAWMPSFAIERDGAVLGLAGRF